MTAAARTAAAQGPTGTPSPRFLLGAGIDGFLRDGDEATPQLALHAGYELRRARTARAALRLGADYTTRHYGATTVRVNGAPVETLDRAGRNQVYGLVLLGTYALAGGRIRPYALGGAGLYGVTGVSREPASAFAAGKTTRVARVSPALSGGLGIAVPVGRVALVGEARVTYLSNGVGGSPRGGRGVVVPLVVGVRF